MKKILIAFLLILPWSHELYAGYSVQSPDGKVKMSVSQTDGGQYVYSMTVDGVKVIDSSILGYKISDGTIIPSASWKVIGKSNKKIRDIWTPIWGKRASVPERYNMLNLYLRNTQEEEIELQLRAYDDGAAFRFVIKSLKGNDVIADEVTEFAFAGDYTAWYYNGERHNLGPEKLSETAGDRQPVMTIKAADHLYLAIHEADLEYGWPLRLTSKAGETMFHVAPDKTPLSSGFKSAWRTIMCADSPGGLVDSHLLELLNPDPASDMDFSWVKPGIALWDWRIDGAVWEGYRYGMNYQSWVKMIDFASEQGFSYLVLDANWYGPEFEKDSDPTKGDKARDVQNIIKYGRERGVGVWLYLNDVAGSNYPIEETLAQYEKWGAAGVKYGFMNGNAMEKNQKTRNITELCAKHHLLVDYHDYPVHPYGQMRTWPNAITREFCKAQLDGRQVFYPKTFVTSVFVNMISGPIDMNNGFFDLRQGRTTRVDNNQEVPSTICAEAARTQITFSGATIIPDIPEYYKKYPSLLRFLSAQKMPWRESSTLAGEIGEYIVMMRQAADGRILVGAATNEEARTIELPLSFLGKGTWSAEISEDAADTHYLTNRETLSVSERTVTSKESITLHLAPGGGACILLHK